MRILFFWLFVFSYPALAEPLFPNSVVSNDLRFIKPTDENAFGCLAFTGLANKEMPGQASGELFANDTRVFEAKYRDGTGVGIWVHPDIGNRAASAEIAKTVAKPLGHLPTLMRRKLSHVIIQKGDDTAFSEHRGHFFVLYDANIAKRLRTNDLPHTIFHESVHATLDADLGTTRAWKQAQESDGAFVTDYAARAFGYSGQNTYSEDMAESALFAWAVLRHPGRLPSKIEQAVKNIMPARLTYFDALFGPGQPLFSPVAAFRGCG